MHLKSVCVLGNGQLGRMLKQAGEPLGIALFPVGVDQDPTMIPYENSVITAEIERWADTPFTQILAKHPHFINRDIFPLIADRLTQKELLDELNLPTAKWHLLTNEWADHFANLGDLLIVKRRTGGYDGRGQWRITKNEIREIPAEIYQQAIVEEAVPFDSEISLVGARSHDGKTVFYPLTNNLQQEGILKMSVVLPAENLAMQQKAEMMLSKIMDRLQYVGVMAMECFVVGDELIINELAPRVHNSGHWTQNGASISQFELHLRAILDLPMVKPVVTSPSVMVNLIGTPLNYSWLTNPLVHLHWYDKEVRAGRKVGHLNLTHHDRALLIEALDSLTLPTEQYQTAIAWAKTKL
ncbi:5-(carboxyamino)imidazole ribonucleotide synthase [Orbaceae bacterium ESL0721]|nr:5-(carboxyamino)imidazole ribonucleotide synthase [Orbaceae bacterium ESL0721]